MTESTTLLVVWLYLTVDLIQVILTEYFLNGISNDMGLMLMYSVSKHLVSIALVITLTIKYKEIVAKLLFSLNV